MAYITTFTCFTCNQSKTEPDHYSGICAQCRQTQRVKEKNQSLSPLLGLELHERIARLESIVYDLQNTSAQWSQFDERIG